MCSQKSNFHYFFAESTWNDCNVAIAMTQATIYGLNKRWLQVFCYRLDFFSAELLSEASTGGVL